MSTILNQIFFSVNIVDLRCLDWHLLFLFFIIWLLTFIFDFVLLVVFRLNRLDFVFIQYFSALNVKDLSADQLRQVLKIFLWFYGVERVLDFAEDVNNEANEVFVIVTDPSIEVNDFIGFF